METNEHLRSFRELTGSGHADVSECRVLLRFRESGRRPFGFIPDNSGSNRVPFFQGFLFHNGKIVLISRIAWEINYHR
jgi:hypothetical protein